MSTRLYKCIFGVEDIPFLDVSSGERGLRTDYGKVKAIVEWPITKNQRTCVSGVASPITYISKTKATLVWLGL